MRTFLLLLALSLLTTGCPMTGGGTSNNNGNDNADDNGNDNGDLPQNLVALFVAALDGEQEMPPVATTGTGSGSVGVTAAGEFVIQLTASGLTGPVTFAHIHIGPPGISGDIVLHLTAHLMESNGQVTINTTVLESDFAINTGQSVLEALRAGVLYFNLHTALNPAGEIRGQLFEADDTPNDDPPAAAEDREILMTIGP